MSTYMGSIWHSREEQVMGMIRMMMMMTLKKAKCPSLFLQQKRRRRPFLVIPNDSRFLSQND